MSKCLIIDISWSHVIIPVLELDSGNSLFTPVRPEAEIFEIQLVRTLVIERDLTLLMLKDCLT